MKLINNFLYKIKFKLYLKYYLKIMRNRKSFKNKIRSLKLQFFDVEYNFDNYLTNKIFKNLPINLATFFRQYNFFKLIRPEKLNFFLLKSKTFNYPLTHEQIIILRKNGFIINNFISSSLFFLSCIKEFFLGILFFLIINFKSIINLVKIDKLSKNKIYIKNLTTDQIKSFKDQPNNIKNWLKEKFFLNNHILVHDNKYCKNYYNFNRLFLPELNTISEVFRFNFYFFKFIFLILIDSFFLRFKQFFIFSEIVKLCSSLSKNEDYYKNNFFFFNGTAFFRPLFSYNLGKNTFFIEYSLNQHFIYMSDDVKEKQYDWRNLTWSNYILWNDQQKKLFEENQDIKAKYYIFGPISFGLSKPIALKEKYENSILIFDSIPFRKSFTATYNVYSPNYFDNNIIKFLTDISNLDNKYSLYIKPKRKFYKDYSKKYKKFFKQNSKFNILHYNNSPEDVIKKFDKIICLPFSSTAYIAKNMNKEVCYYDVVGIHEDFDNIIKDIPIFRKFSDLKNWSESEK